MKQLSKAIFTGTPEAALSDLPEKVLQFGTGVLLRGLPDYLIDQANRQGIFNGRIVAVKSTAGGDIRTFRAQDNLYTVCIRGIKNDQPVAEYLVSASISRVLSADDQWSEILACASNPTLEIILSNTTEVGIQLVREDIRQNPPASFPGKLLAFLYTRWQAFQGDVTKGFIVVPTELVPQNGDLLKSVVRELAVINQLEPLFLAWLDNACTFCNSLVDRIVTGLPAADKQMALMEELGYQDHLITTTEPYCLWAIEGNDRVLSVLTFYKANPETMIIAPDINRFRELKLRLLNGTHTLSCGLACLAGIPTVRAAMEDPDMAAFIEKLMLHEIVPAIPYDLAAGEAEKFGLQVLERFRNPYVEHLWRNITVQYTAKMRMRNVAVLQEHYRKRSTVPLHMAFGFAAYLCFFRQPDFPVQDDHATWLTRKWQAMAPGALAMDVLQQTDLWGVDITRFPGFAEQVQEFVLQIIEQGIRPVLHAVVQSSPNR
jgi:tagaturonate reductase